MLRPDRYHVTGWVTCFSFLLLSISCLDQCYIKPEVVVPDADVQFGLLLSLRQQQTSTTSGEPPVCGHISRPALEQHLATEWLVSRINAHNNGTGYVPGVKIGFQTMDDCGSPLYASRDALNFLDKWSPHTDQCAPTPTAPASSEPVPIGIVGSSSSDIAMEVASLVRQVPLPLISMAATIPELSDKRKYPTFMRTVPQDELQMDAIADLLHQLKWTYVTVIHINDSYGRAASENLARLAASRGICIQRTLVLTSGALAGNDFSRDLSDLLQNSKDASLAVVFIGRHADADDLLWTIDRLGKLEGRDIKFGFRVILTASKATVMDTKIFQNIAFGEGTLALGGIQVDMSADLEADLRALYKSVKSGKTRHALIEEYIRGSPDGELYQASEHSSLVPLTLHGILALVEGLRTVHTGACQGMPGLCPAMANKIDSGDLLTAARTTSLNYASMEPGIAPQAFRDQGIVMSFDKQGDVTLPKSSPAYILHQYRRGWNKYEKVGQYAGRRMVLQPEQLQWVSSSGQATSQLPTSVCRDRCDTHCLSAKGKGQVPLVFMPGTQGYIIGVFSMHDTDRENPFRCGDFRYVSNDAVVAEGFLYAVRRMRTLTGLDIGAVGIDDCYSPLRPLSILHSLLSNLTTSIANDFLDLGNFRLDQVLGVVGCRSSGCTIPVASFFMQLNVPVVSYASSSPDLDDKAEFPFFLRTVPSDTYQAQAMLHIVRAMGWEYVGMLYVRNSYGTKAMEAFKELARQSRLSGGEDAGVNQNSEGEPWPGLCVAKEIAVEERSSALDERHFLQIWTQLMAQDAKVVVFFGIDSRYRAFLSYLEREGKHGDFIFLSGEDWGTNQEILQANPKAARGSLTLKVEEVDLEDVTEFRKHLAQKRPSLDDPNIWFLEFWQHIFQCNWPGGFLNTFNRDCNPDWNLSEDELAWRTAEQRFRHMMNAVYAMIRGLQEARVLCEQEFPCGYLRLKADEVTEKIRQQKRAEGSPTFPVFDTDGNGALGFDIFSIQRLEGGSYDYRPVGSFNSRATPTFEKEKLRFYTETGGALDSYSARCTKALCGHCPSLTPTPEPPTGSHCKSKYQESDIVIISLVGVLILAFLVAVAAVVLCFCRRNSAFRKQLAYKTEQIYDEPERQVYQQYIDTHGFHFANMNMEPLLRAGVNPPPRPGLGLQQYHNEAFVDDRLDSVSQIVANTRTQSQQLSQSPAGMVSPSPSQRPLPVSPMGPTDTMSSIMQDNRAYHEALSDVTLPRRVVSNVTSPVHSSRTARSNNTPSHISNNNGAMSPCSTSSNFTSNTSGATVNSSQNSSQASPFYHQRGPKATSPHHFVQNYVQPVDQYGSPVAIDPRLLQQYSPQNVPGPGNPRVVTRQASDESSVHPEYGPYSTAEAQRRQMQQYPHQGQPQQFSPVQHSKLQNVAEHYYPDNGNYQQQQLQQHQQQQQQQQQQQHPSPPDGHPPQLPLSMNEYLELRDMPGHTFFTPPPLPQQPPTQEQQQQQQQQQQLYQQQLYHQPRAQQQQLHESLQQPHPQQGGHQDMHQIQQQQLQQQQREAPRPHIPQREYPRPHPPMTSQMSTSRDMPPHPEPAANATQSPGPVTRSSGQPDTGLTSPHDSDHNLEGRVDVHFDPALSHDPRPPNDQYMESIDLASNNAALPEVNTQGGRGTGKRSNLLALSVLGGNVSKV